MLPVEPNALSFQNYRSAGCDLLSPEYSRTSSKRQRKWAMCTLGTSRRMSPVTRPLSVYTGTFHTLGDTYIYDELDLILCSTTNI